MNVKDLHPYGAPLESIVFNDSGDIAQFYVVEYDGRIVGVALYYNLSETATFALTTAKNSFNVLIGDIGSDAIVRAEDIEKLETFYYQVFSGK